MLTPPPGCDRSTDAVPRIGYDPYPILGRLRTVLYLGWLWVDRSTLTSSTILISTRSDINIVNVAMPPMPPVAANSSTRISWAVAPAALGGHSGSPGWMSMATW